MRPDPRTDSDLPIRLEGLAVRYGWFRNPPVLDGIDLEVTPGEVRVLLGRNGEGKSSLVRCLLGHQKPTRGRAELFGEDVWRFRARLMHRVGVVPEEPDAPPGLAPFQLSKFCRHVHRRWDEVGFRARLERFEVPLDRTFGRLSKGQKGQVQLALALGHSPDLLVLDDPTLGLDAVARRALFEELVDELSERGVTVFLTSHDLAGVETIASRISLLSGGRLRLDEELETLRGRVRRIGATLPATEEASVHELLRPWVPVSIERLGRRWIVVVERFDDEAVARLAAAGATDLEVSALGLEEIFLALVGPAADAEGAETAAARRV